MKKTKAEFNAPLHRGIFIAPAILHANISQDVSLLENLLGSPYQGRGNNDSASTHNTKKLHAQNFLNCYGNVNFNPIENFVFNGLNGSRRKKKCVVNSVLATLFDNFLATSDLADSLAISHIRA